MLVPRIVRRGLSTVHHRERRFTVLDVLGYLAGSLPAASPAFPLMRLPLCLTASALLVSAAGAGAQASPTVDGRRLPQGVDSLAVYLVRGGDTTLTGMIREELTQVDEGGRRLVHRVYATMDQILGLRLDSLVDVAETLEPVRHRSRTENGAEYLDFADGRVTGWLRMANGDTVSVATPLPPGVVNASAFDLVLRAADLRDGWSAEVPAFMPNARAVVPLHARVVGTDTVAGEACWRVAAEFTGMPVTFWIGQSSRRLRQQVMHIGPDAVILFRTAVPRPATKGAAGMD